MDNATLELLAPVQRRQSRTWCWKPPTCTAADAVRRRYDGLAAEEMSGRLQSDGKATKRRIGQAGTVDWLTRTATAVMVRIRATLTTISVGTDPNRT